MKRLGFVLVLALMTAMFAFAVPAQATFPGSNGRITFGSDRYGTTGDPSNNTHNIFTMESESHDIQRLTSLGSKAEGAALWSSWSPDGSRIVFTIRNEDQSVRQLYLMDANGEHQHLLFSEPLGFTDFQPSFSPDGSHVIFSRCEFDQEWCAIYTVKTDGHGLTAITSPTQNQRQDIFDNHPRYSPDGKTIAFESINRGGVIGAVYLSNARGANIRRITPTGLEAFEPEWAPDGRSLVFSDNCCRFAENALWSVAPDGSGRTQLTYPAGGHDSFASYSPDGSRIAFERDSADGSTFSIVTMAPNGGDLETIQATDAFYPNWGPG